MTSRIVAGWDIGGAHLKLVALDGDRHVRALSLLPCPLWQGLGHLERALADALARVDCTPSAHAVTMTGELCDLFASRAEGVERILATVQHACAPVSVQVYACDAGLVPQAPASSIASMNWHAMARALAEVVPDALLIDVGSTTTDITPIAEGQVRAQALHDRERLATDELVYQGIARTPVMALAARAPYRGRWQGIAAEHFATMADIYRLLGELPPDADLMPSADGRPKTVPDSAARLARMVGDDADVSNHPDLLELARWLRGVQCSRLRAAALRVHGAARPRRLVGAGVGRFLVRELALSLGVEYLDYAAALGVTDCAGASDCAPALAVACLGLGA